MHRTKWISGEKDPTSNIDDHSLTWKCYIRHKVRGKKYECFQWHSMLKTIKKVTAFLISFFFFVSTDHRKKLETKQELVLVSSLKEWQCMKVLAPTQLIFNYWLKRHIVKKRTEARFTKINFLSNKIIFHLSFREKSFVTQFKLKRSTVWEKQN